MTSRKHVNKFSHTSYSQQSQLPEIRIVLCILIRWIFHWRTIRQLYSNTVSVDVLCEMSYCGDMCACVRVCVCVCVRVWLTTGVKLISMNGKVWVGLGLEKRVTACRSTFNFFTVYFYRALCEGTSYSTILICMQKRRDYRMKEAYKRLLSITQYRHHEVLNSLWLFLSHYWSYTYSNTCIIKNP